MKKLMFSNNILEQILIEINYRKAILLIVGEENLEII